MTRPAIGPLPVSRTGRNALEVASDAARRTGQIIRERFPTPKEISFKGPANLVTDVDLASDQIIRELLQAEFPGYNILSEESEPTDTGSPYTWVVDPLDGTRNYAYGIPHFCVVVALARKDEIVLGLTYDPMREELFTGRAGQGRLPEQLSYICIWKRRNVPGVAGLRPGLRGRAGGTGPGYGSCPLAEDSERAPDGGLRPWAWPTPPPAG